MSPYQWLIYYLEITGSGHHGKLWQCPAHEDSSPSLSVTQGQEGRVLVHCFSGCQTEHVLSALGLSMLHLFETSPYPPEKAHRLALLTPKYPRLVPHHGHGARSKLGVPIDTGVHYYLDDVRLRRERYAGGRKSLTWESLRWDGWRSGLDVKLNDLPLYREREVLQGALVGEEVIVCESESSVDALSQVGIYATTWAGGAASPNLKRLVAVLDGHRVLLVPDHDEAGLLCGAHIKQALEGVTETFREIVPDPGDDARDLLNKKGWMVFRALSASA